VAGLWQSLPSRQYPGAHPGSDATADGAGGEALTTSPVSRSTQTGAISQYPAGQRGSAGLWDCDIAEVEMHPMTIPTVASANVVKFLFMTCLIQFCLIQRQRWGDASELENGVAEVPFEIPLSDSHQTGGTVDVPACLRTDVQLAAEGFVFFIDRPRFLSVSRSADFGSLDGKQGAQSNHGYRGHGEQTSDQP
jgi:hypothetical protein